MTKHLVFISSIAAQSGSYADHDLTEDDFPTPNNAYGRSKFAAEQAIRAAGISFTILRPVVIYGEGEKGNFATVHRISRLPIPLPFGALSAQRSVLSIENFNSAVATALSNPRAQGETFIVSDPAPVTVADLIARYRASLRQITLADAGAPKLDQVVTPGHRPGRDLGADRPASGGSTNQALCRSAGSRPERSSLHRKHLWRMQVPRSD